MHTIYKYILKAEDEQILKLPIGSKILTAQVQRGEICLWALVTGSFTAAERTICIHGTGHPIAKAYNLTYISTVQLDGGSLVFHIFERTKE